jgi:hypothetical protein
MKNEIEEKYKGNKRQDLRKSLPTKRTKRKTKKT